MRLEVSEDARRDLTTIYRQGVEMFGFAQADRYIDALLEALDVIAQFPDIARPRDEVKPPVEAYPHGSHVILYDRDERGDVIIIRIRHSLEDWQGRSGVEDL